MKQTIFLYDQQDKTSQLQHTLGNESGQEVILFNIETCYNTPNNKKDMTFHESQGNIFTLPKAEYVFAHCIATDLRWGAGIAPVMMKQFKASSRWRKNTNATVYKVGDIGVDESNTGVMINLFTKSHTHGRPSYQAMEQCLVNLRNWMIAHDRKRLAIPKIGCGLDGLSWPMVREHINQIFQNADIVIEVRYL